MLIVKAALHGCHIFYKSAVGRREAARVVFWMVGLDLCLGVSGFW